MRLISQWWKWCWPLEMVEWYRLVSLIRMDGRENRCCFYQSGRGGGVFIMIVFVLVIMANSMEKMLVIVYVQHLPVAVV